MGKYFVDINGNYLGSFDGLQPQDGTEVPSPPPHANCHWNGASFDPYIRPAQEVADESALNSARENVVIQYLLTHTPQECVDYVNTNVTSLATAKDLLGHMAVALCVLVRKGVRA